MTRFARAKGSKASNQRIPEDATSWQEMKQGLLQKNNANRTEGAGGNTVSFESANNRERFADLGSKGKTPVKWSDFPDLDQTTKNPKKAKKDPTVNSTVEQSETKVDGKKKRKVKKSEDEDPENEQNKSGSNTNEDNSEVKKKKKKNKKFNEGINNSEEPPNQENVTETKSPNQENVTETKTKKAKKHKITSDDVDETSEFTGNRKNKKQKMCETSDKQDDSTSMNSNQSFYNNNKRNFFKNDRRQFNNGHNRNQRPYPEAANGRHDSKNNTEYKRRKPNSQIDKIFINGNEVEIAYYDGFPIKREDAERLKNLKKEMVSRGLPRSEIAVALKLERRRAEKALAREKKKVCFNCRGSGHTLSECPSLKSDPGTQLTETGICFKCGSTEHTHFECKVTRGDNFKFAQCFICKEQGHIARQCPDNNKGLYPKGGACRVCGDVTHLKKDCPKYQSEQEENKIVAHTIDDQNIESLENETVKVNKKSKNPQKIIKF